MLNISFMTQLYRDWRCNGLTRKEQPEATRNY
jgi:hypothetical protein